MFLRKDEITCSQRSNVTIPILELYSDSTVFGLLKMSPEVLKILEADRVKKIQDTCRNIEWTRMYSEHDLVNTLSRGQYPREFSKNLSWLQAPAWLCKPELSHPESRERVYPPIYQA